MVSGVCPHGWHAPDFLQSIIGASAIAVQYIPSINGTVFAAILWYETNKKQSVLS